MQCDDLLENTKFIYFQTSNININIVVIIIVITVTIVRSVYTGTVHVYGTHHLIIIILKSYIIHLAGNVSTAGKYMRPLC